MHALCLAVFAVSVLLLFDELDFKAFDDLLDVFMEPVPGGAVLVVFNQVLVQFNNFFMVT